MTFRMPFCRLASSNQTVNLHAFPLSISMMASISFLVSFIIFLYSSSEDSICWYRLEMFYNRIRRHLAVGYRNPKQYEDGLLKET